MIVRAMEISYEKIRTRGSTHTHTHTHITIDSSSSHLRVRGRERVDEPRVAAAAERVRDAAGAAGRARGGVAALLLLHLGELHEVVVGRP